jgi:hypothetical protein
MAAAAAAPPVFHGGIPGFASEAVTRDSATVFIRTAQRVVSSCVNPSCSSRSSNTFETVTAESGGQVCTHCGWMQTLLGNIDNLRMHKGFKE